ncbi:MAG: NFACT family protein [Candidatus Odinarchaeum yellowstonii]|uniref:NFACT family protein n=1 Tax=Odinarchaeota yellowstonii (strain LCB_4) TaxID=1841599 RepID=A0AAF0IBT9_ODILC|nr:MAG: NFACT family protein [Candidatus Odinarchaeum yellowstonii]
MLNVKTSMSNIDLNAVTPLLKRSLVGSWLNNVYQNENIFLLKFRSAQGEIFTLLAEPGKRVHLTCFKRSTPKTPSSFVMSLRDKIKNAKLIEINQHDLDRIIYLVFEKKNEKYTLIIELFGDGNILLLNSLNQILYALKYVKMKDRAILPKQLYVYPPLRGRDPLEISLEDLEEIARGSSKDIIHTLVANLNIASEYAEEVLLKSNIEFTTPAKTMSRDQLKILMENLKTLLTKIKSVQLSPCIFSDNQGRRISVAPFNLVKYSHLNREEYTDFNEALDEFFIAYESQTTIFQLDEKVKSKIESLERIRREQEEAVKLLKAKIQLHKTVGDLIYSNYPIIDELLRTVKEARDKKIEWDEIIIKLNKAKELKIPSALIFKELKQDQAELTVEVNGVTFSLDFRKSLNQNADHYYTLAKKEEVKLKGALSALEETNSKINELISKSEELKPKPVKKTRKKEWYERFRWFITSDNLLVIGGRDAKSNEQLIKKFTDKTDIVFHADIHGAPIVVLKTGGQTPPETSINEAAQFAASYSSAWGKGAGGVDVYYVKPDQISFSPPSGQYLPKGSFIINGPRTYIRNQPLNLTFGVVLKNDYPIPVCGPHSAIMKLTNIIVPLKLGDLSSGKLAKKIKEYLKKKVKKEEQQLIEELSLDEIQNILPPGGGEIADKFQLTP